MTSEGKSYWIDFDYEKFSTKHSENGNLWWKIQKFAMISSFRHQRKWAAKNNLFSI